MKLLNKTVTLRALLSLLADDAVRALADRADDLSEVLVNVQVWDDTSGLYNSGVNGSTLDGLFLVATGCTTVAEVERAARAGSVKRPYVTVDDRSKNTRLVYRIA